MYILLVTEKIIEKVTSYGESYWKSLKVTEEKFISSLKNLVNINVTGYDPRTGPVTFGGSARDFEETKDTSTPTEEFHI